MSIEEFNEIAQHNGWAYGSCGNDMWPEIEQTYNRTDLTKTEICYLYWVRTGWYENVASAVKGMMECEDVMYKAIRARSAANCIMGCAIDVAAKARAVVDVVAKAKRIVAARRERAV